MRGTTHAKPAIYAAGCTHVTLARTILIRWISSDIGTGQRTQGVATA